MTKLLAFRKNHRKPAILYVNAKWCGFCKTTRPEMEKAAATLGSVVPIYDMDADRNKGDVENLKMVTGYPTILFVDATGKTTVYRGERVGKNLADWACAQSGNCGRSSRG